MAEFISLRMEGDNLLIEGKLAMAKAKHLLRDAIDDIADAVEQEASRQAPEDTGALKAHPVDRDDTRIGVVEPNVFQFASGGGPGVPGARGSGGQFMRGGAGLTPGELIARSTITIAEKPFYAKLVHEGTGVYGPRGTPIVPHTQSFMVFPASRFPTARFKRKIYRFQSVLGQKAQPYLTEAYLLIDRTYVPARIGLLRAQMAAEL